MNTILLILSISGLSLAAEQGWWEIFEKPLKPFSCSVCLSLWLGIATAMTLHEPYIAFVPYLITKIISKYLLK